MQDLVFNFERTIPESLEIGKGAVWVFSGYCFHLTERVTRMSVLIGSMKCEIKHIGEVREDVAIKYRNVDENGNSLGSGFWGMIPLNTSLIGRREEITCLVVTSSGNTFRRRIGEMEFTEIQREPILIKQQASSNQAPLVVVCMGTYEPDIAVFERQIQSIIDQQYPNWICIVHDDGSDKDKRSMIQEICQRDQRIFFRYAATNRGFYWNFEACLRYVPEQAEYIALADQDDYWYPNKLTALVESIKDEVLLTYSDMRLMDDNGQTISNTYWSNRKNNFQNLHVLLLANTVTGAALMFKATLLKEILPFPERIGDAFHDHWIACSALYRGNINYVDRPLYDYLQHDRSVIGHCDFTTATQWARLKHMVVVLTHLLAVHKLKSSSLKLRNSFLGVYRHECRRIEVMAETMRIRSKPADSSKDGALKAYGGSIGSVLRLVWLHFYVWRNGDTTNGAELRLAGGYLASLLDRIGAPFLRYSLRRENCR